MKKKRNSNHEKDLERNESKIKEVVGFEVYKIGIKQSKKK